MKRSEMVQSLFNVINEEMQNICKITNVAPDLAERYSWSIASKALADVEEAGMIPPEVDLDKCSDPVYSISRSYFDEHVPSRFMLGWEDE